MLGSWMATTQQNSYADLVQAVLQRQAITLGESFIVGLDLDDMSKSQQRLDRLISQISELQEVVVYIPDGANYRVVLAGDQAKLGQIITDSQKQKVAESLQTVTYQRQVLNAEDNTQVIDTTVIPLIPITTEGQLVALVEVNMSTQQVVDLGGIYLGNNAFFFGALTVLLVLASLVWGWAIYRRRVLIQAAQADITRKDELLAIAAHDLRGPIIVIRQDIKEIIDKGMELGAERYHKLSDEILRSALQTIEFLEDLLLVSRFERNKEQIFPRPAFLQETLAQLVEQFVPQAQAKGLGIELVSDISNLPKVIIDPGKIGECISNYISNAIKYSDSGKVEVSVEIKTGKKTKYIVVGVKDQGVGITSEDQQKLFQSFSRVGETRQTHPGNGLGLYIVKQIIESHGGRVGVSSELGRGSTFYLTIPVPSTADLEGAEESELNK